jgi:type III restriction enzyme
MPYIANRIDFAGCHPCEIGLQTYAQRIISMLAAAITPDDTKGETPLLPRLNRYKPVGSTEKVHFKTVKPVQVTAAGHLNLVACDADSWEQAAVFQLEKLAQEGVVYCYARNDRLDFNLPYELYGVPHVYEPDFLVRLTSNLAVLIKVKGKIYDNTDVKDQAPRRWVSAVNHWGRLGQWDFLPCRNPHNLSTELAKLIASQQAAPATTPKA